MLRSSDFQYAAAGTDPPWPPLLKGGSLRNIRGGKSPLLGSRVFNSAPPGPPSKGGSFAQHTRREITAR